MDTLKAVAEFVASLGTLGGFAIAVTGFLIPQLRRLPRRVEEWFISHREERIARATRDKRMTELMELLPDIRTQLHPNGGDSLRDRVDHAVDVGEQAVKEASRVERKLDQHIADTAVSHEDLHDRMGRMEAREA